MVLAVTPRGEGGGRERQEVSAATVEVRRVDSLTEPRPLCTPHCPLPSCSRRHGAGPVNHRQPPAKTSSVPTPPRQPPGSPCHGPLVTAPGALPLPSACCFSISGPPHSPAWHSFSQCPSLTRRSLRYWLSPFRVPRTVLRLWDRRGARQGVPSHGVGVFLGPTDPNPACPHTHKHGHTVYQVVLPL